MIGRFPEELPHLFVYVQFIHIISIIVFFIGEVKRIDCVLQYFTPPHFDIYAILCFSKHPQYLAVDNKEVPYHIPLQHSLALRHLFRQIQVGS